MTTKILDDAVSCLLGKSRRDQVPYLAVLGPSGSGKTDFVTSLRTKLERHSKEDLHISLDLKTIPVGSEDQLYHRLLDQAQRQVDRVTGGRSPDLRFDQFVQSLLRSNSGRVIIYLDHLDSVPRFFARSLSRLFRQFLDESSEATEYSRLSAVFVGALSLFDLRLDKDSPFTLGKTILQPSLDKEIEKQLVRQRIKQCDWQETPEEIIEHLAVETGGEPAFLEPVLQSIAAPDTPLILDKDTVIGIIEDKCSLTSTLPILQELTFHFYGSEHLREVVEKLCAGSFVPAADMAVDIDRYHLLGCVVINSTANPERYRFRNGMVDRYLRNLVEAQRTLRLFDPGMPKLHRVQVSNFPALQRIRKIEILRSKIIEAQNIWEILYVLRSAWEEITPLGTPHLYMYLKTRDGRSWWLDGKTHLIHVDPSLASKRASAPKRAAEEVVSEKLASFAFDEREIAFGSFLRRGVVDIVLVVAIENSDRNASICEGKLINWNRFLQNTASGISNSALVRIFIDEMKGSTEVVDGGTATAASWVRRIERAKQVVFQSGSREFAIWRIAGFLVFLVAFVVCLIAVTPIVSENWDTLEPIAWLIGVGLAGLASIVAVLGYKRQWLNVVSEFEKRGRDRIYHRRLRKAGFEIFDDPVTGTQEEP